MTAIFQWLLIDWKLKVLSFGLTVLLLGAVSFANSPVQTVTLNAHISYDNTPRTGLVLNNPPATTRATISGTAAQIRTAVITADIDLSKLAQGTAIAVTPVPNNTGSDARVMSISPVTLDVEDYQAKTLNIDVRASAAQGWQITSAQAVCGSPPSACQVAVLGPATLFKDLVAYAVVDSPISANTREQLATLIHFERGGTLYDIGSITTIPAITWSPQTVTAIVQAKQGVSTVQVALLDALPSAPPPAGYRVTAVVINPQLITISGAQDVVAGIQAITLPAVSLAPYTSDHTFNVRIPNSDPRIHLSTAVVQVTYKIARNPAVSPTP
jgi:YbbR domain-containing protein